MNKVTIKKFIDILMIIIFIIMMGYHITGNKAHEILGLVTFIFFIIHNILNIKWYKTIFKGSYNFRRIFTLVVNVFLLLAIFSIIISGIMISNIFSFLNISTTMFGRKLHLISTSWGFVLMSIHVGLHLPIILMKINKKIKTSTFEYIYYLILIMLATGGLYFFIINGMYKDMFLLTEFKFFDYDQNPLLFYLSIFLILSFFSLTTYSLLLFHKKIQNNKKSM